jgi:hypothetical protein
MSVTSNKDFELKAAEHLQPNGGAVASRQVSLSRTKDRLTLADQIQHHLAVYLA